jgi:hypothetical protein
MLQIALMPASLAGAVFRESFPPPPQPEHTAACPATVRWPEGVLTHALLSGGTHVRELVGIRTKTLREDDPADVAVDF